MSDFKPSPHQTGRSITFGDSASDTHEITGSTTHHGTFTSTTAIVAQTTLSGAGEIQGKSLSVAGNVTGASGIMGHTLAIQAGLPVTGSSTHHGGLNVEGIVSSSAGFKSSKAYQAPARDLVDIDNSAGDNFDWTGSLITQRSGQCLFTLGVALSASYPGNAGITGFRTTNKLFTQRSNAIINPVDGTYTGVGGGDLSPTALLFETPYFVTYGGDTYWCLFKFVNNTGGTIAADKTFKLNFTII